MWPSLALVFATLACCVAAGCGGDPLSEVVRYRFVDPELRVGATTSPAGLITEHVVPALLDSASRLQADSPHE